MVTVALTKTVQRPMFRSIAIPKCLIVFLDGEGVSGRLKLSECTVGRQIRVLFEKPGALNTGIDIELLSYYT